MIWYESGGTGLRSILLLHGLGATAAVWNGVRRAIEQRAIGRLFAPDLGGHGGSDWQRHYTVGGHAVEVAELAQGEQELFVIGHSLGAYIGLALASRWFGVEVSGVLGVGPKITWSQAICRARASWPVGRCAGMERLLENGEQCNTLQSSVDL